MMVARGGIVVGRCSFNGMGHAAAKDGGRKVD